MARARLTKPEREALAAALSALDAGTLGELVPVPRRHVTALRGLLEKAEASLAPVQREAPGLSLARVETCLAPAGDRYARWVGGSPARPLAELHAARATDEQLDLVARYIASWSNFGGAVTLGAIARRWGEWLSGAVAWSQKNLSRQDPAPPQGGSHW